VLCDSIIIASGDSLDLSIDWGETALLRGAPDTVGYQVFDYLTGLPIGDVQYADVPDAITTFLVDGDYLTNYNADKRRRLRVQVVGLFGDDRKTVFVDVFVEKVFEMDVVSDPSARSGDTIPYYNFGHAMAIDGIGV